MLNLIFINMKVAHLYSCFFIFMSSCVWQTVAFKTGYLQYKRTKIT
jgi:hypothetical protein